LKDIKYNKRGEIEELPLKKFKRRDLIKLEDSIYKDKDIDDPIWNFYTKVNGAGQMIKIPGTEYIRLPVRETSDTVVTQDFLNYIPISSEEFTQIYGLSCPKLKDVIEYAKKRTNHCSRSCSVRTFKS
jgi:tRNA(Phe) wybutosine-synthesizing methylase Tyw3